MDSCVNDFILTTENLSREFKGIRAVSDLSLKVRRGEIHALIGPNGAGKTTVFNLLTGFFPPTRGKIFFQGQDVTGVRPAQLARRGMIRSFQISAVFPELTALENVRLALQRHAVSAYSFWRSEKIVEPLNEKALELLATVGIAEHAHTKASALAYGRKRVLEIATTLAAEPELMLLDEPTQGMGHEDVGRITELIRKVAQNRTVLMVEHNLQVVSSLANRITVLSRGSLLAEGPYAEVAKDPRVIEAYLGTEATHGH